MLLSEFISQNISVEVQHGLDLPDRSLPLSDLQRLLRLPETLEEQDMKKGESSFVMQEGNLAGGQESSAHSGVGGFCSALRL